MGDADSDTDGLTYLYYHNKFIDVVKNVSGLFFTFVDSFPSQEPFQRSSNLTITVMKKGKPNQQFIICPENLSLVEDIANTASSSVDFRGLICDVDYLINRSEPNNIIMMTIKYSMTFLDVDELGIIEWRSRLRKTETKIIGGKKVQDRLNAEVFPISILVVDAIAMIFSFSRFISFFKHARQYAKQNYVSFYRAVMWKVDRWELFNLSYQILTFVSILTFLIIVEDDFGAHRWLLCLLGTAGFVHSMGLFRSLRMKEELWLVSRLTGRSLGQSSTLAFGFVPIYLGFVFMGIAFFGYFCNVFKGFLRTIKVLFSIFHCDIVMDTVELVKEFAVVPDWLIISYIVVWTNLTCGIIINVIISIVEVTLDVLIHEGLGATTTNKIK
ncbi:hypothetical protein TVAG_152880 [Trichomonas vaginalis G3]|uniref:Polycystin cation channel PKD1/PKD2 domain-containing protein n=1 Tax=Trichomonas vaginalis (strain ATCC PRA-98 / G3) TaxID=412133 RepID=A2G2Z8_TRIV3|nr:mucolipin family [Trichomonas vaginalis G3]EAX88467.1 hypothetical protein TVAG_152880 [Trichomonas vaginalis G3]KAI5522668.1 mucolipin family [Trichomonas vaginalis G3]|eukprot:XP_001301397.1 hypothetical protein [Trichomonas vaginalis G3]